MLSLVLMLSLAFPVDLYAEGTSIPEVTVSEAGDQDEEAKEAEDKITADDVASGDSEEMSGDPGSHEDSDGDSGSSGSSKDAGGSKNSGSSSGSSSGTSGSSSGSSGGSSGSSGSSGSGKSRSSGTSSAETSTVKVHLEKRTLKADLVRTKLYEKKKPTAEVIFSDRFLFALYEREPGLQEKHTKNSPLQVEVTGKFPEDVTAEASFIEYDELDEEAIVELRNHDAVTEIALFSVELAFYDGDGAPYEPQGKYTVELSGKTLWDTVTDDLPVLVYVWEENEKRSEKRDGEYCADVTVYKDKSAKKKFLCYQETDKGAVRYTNDEDGLKVTKENTVTWKAESSSLHFLVSAQLKKPLREASTESENSGKEVYTNKEEEETTRAIYTNEPEETSKAVYTAEAPEEESTKAVYTAEAPEEESTKAVYTNEPTEESKKAIYTNEPEEETTKAVYTDEPEKETKTSSTSAEGQKAGSTAAVDSSKAEEEQKNRESRELYTSETEEASESSAEESADSGEETAAESEKSGVPEPSMPEESSEETTHAGSPEETTYADASEETTAADSSEGTASAGSPEDSASDDEPEAPVLRTLSKNVSNKYKISVTYEVSEQIPANARLIVREIKASDPDFEEYLGKSTEELGLSEEELTFVRVFDIKVVHPTLGTEFQPDESMDVKIELLDEVFSEEPDLDVDVLHFHEEPDSKEEVPEVLDTTVDGEILEFRTDGFSVYVIIGHVGETEVVNSRVEFHFIDKEYTEYVTGDGESQEVYYTAGAFSFVNKAKTRQQTQILKNGESLEMIANPANRTLKNEDGTSTEQYFFGWYVVDGSSDGDRITYSWTEDPQEISFEQPLTITSSKEKPETGDMITWKIRDVSGEAVLDEEGTAHVYLAPVYEDYYFINYRLGPKEDRSGLSESLLVRKLVALGSDGKAEVRIGGVTGVSPDARHQVFSGWESVTSDNETRHYYRTVDENGREINEPSDGTGYYASFTKDDFTDRSLDLYPVFAESRWLYFNTGKSGNGATYVGAGYRLTNDDEAGTYFDSAYFSDAKNQTKRSGFAFRGWYADVNQDAATGEITNLTSEGEVVTKYFRNGEEASVTESKKAFCLVNADGTLNDCSRSVTDDGKTYKLYEVVDGKLYFYKALDDLTVYALWEEVEDTSYSVIVWQQKVTDDKNAADANKTYDYYDSVTDVPASSGKTLEDLAGSLTYYQSYSGGDFTGFHYRTMEMSTQTVAGDGTTVINFYYDRDLMTVGFRKNGQSSFTLGETATTYTATTSNSGTQYGLVNGEYVQLTSRSSWGQRTWQYTLNGTTYTYTGTRYTRSTENLLSWTGLYGQTFERNGYDWAEVSGWLWREGASSGTYQTMLYGFTQTSNPYYLYCQGKNGTYAINHYRQQLDGTYSESEKTSAYTTGSSSNFNFTNKFNGYSVAAYSTKAEGFVSAGGTHAVSVGSSASLDTPFYVYHTRNSYTLTFDVNYPTLAGLEYGNGQDENRETEVLFGAPLSSYGSGGADFWEPKGPDHYTFDGWYEDDTGTTPFKFDSEMPAANKVLYARWSPVEFRVEIDPNGAEIDHINHAGYAGYGLEAFRYSISGDYRQDQSTYFNARYNESVSEYTLTRSYVPMSDAVADAYAADGGTVYYYLNTQYQETDGRSIPADLRNALYITEEEIASYYAFYKAYLEAAKAEEPAKYAEAQVLGPAAWRQSYVSTQKYREKYTNENYEFQGWFRVLYDENGEETGLSAMPYDFSDPVTDVLTLRAVWRLDGGYRILYTPEYVMADGTIINGEMAVWEDPATAGANYADGADTEALQQPMSITANGVETGDYIFRGWRIVSHSSSGSFTPLQAGVYYQPGDPFTIDASFADSHGIIRMQAVYESKDSSYRRPYITNLTLDANGGFLTLDGETALEENTDLSDTWKGVIGTVAATVATEEGDEAAAIGFGDIQSGQTVALYRYAADLTEDAAGAEISDTHNYFLHPEGHFLLGFDEEPAEGDYIASYPADSLIAVTRNDARTLYAVWEPMVYLTLRNETGYGTVSFSLHSENSTALQVVNAAKGGFERYSMEDIGSIQVKDGEILRLAIPRGAGHEITISGTNSLGAGILLSAESILASEPDTVRAGFSKVRNNKTFELSDTLVTDQDGLIVTFTAEPNPFTLVLDDNYEGGSTQEIYFSESEDGSVYYEAESVTSYDLPTTSTRIGYELAGWSEDADWAADHDVDTEKPEYHAGARTIEDLTDFFTGEEEFAVKTLYAVWKVNREARVVYVYKSVPEPGSQEKAFTFTVGFSGTYTYSYYQNRQWKNSAAQTIPMQSAAFTLSHGQYLKITSAKHVGDADTRSFLQSVVQKYSADGTQVGDDVTLKWEWQAWDGSSSTQGVDITFTSQQFYVTEANAAADYYDTDLVVSGSTTEYPLTRANERKLSWEEAEAGGTAVFTNTRQTADITIKKELENDTNQDMTFRFRASYTLTEKVNGEETADSKDLGKFEVTSGTSGYVLGSIPVGAVLRVEEYGTDLEDYTTTVSQGGTAVPDGQYEETETTENGTITWHRTVEYTVAGDDTDITYKNVLKSYPVTFRKVDQDGNPGVEAYFRLTSEAGTIGQQMYPDLETGIFAPKKNGASVSTLYCGAYTLTETWVDTENYIGLDTSITLTLSGKDGGTLTAKTSDGDAAKVSVTGDAASGFVVTIYNQKIVDINIAKVMEDAILTTSRSFFFRLAYSYELNGQTIRVDRKGDSAIEVESGKMTSVKVPVGAERLTVSEETDRYANASDTIAETYDTTVQYNGETAVTGSSYLYNEAVAESHDGDTLTFTNIRKTVEITLKKTVTGDDLSGDFRFLVTILNGALPIRGYAVYDGGTADDSSDDWITDQNGVVTLPADESGSTDLILHHDESRTIRIPVGADVTVHEELTADQKEKYAVFITMSGSENLEDGAESTFRLKGPTEDKTIRVFNIPSICKVTDGNAVLLYRKDDNGTSEDDTDDIYMPAIFGTIRDAFSYINTASLYRKSGSAYESYTEIPYQVQMLTDYEVPHTDVVSVKAGHELTFTTAERNAADGYSFRSARPRGTDGEDDYLGAEEYRALLYRDADNQKAFITVNAANSSSATIFTMKDLVIDGMNADLEDGTKGGALTAYKSSVTIDHCKIMNFRSDEGGAVYTTGSDLTVTNQSYFYHCKSELSGDGNGGGAIRTKAQEVLIEDSVFDTCVAERQAGAIYHDNAAAGAILTMSGSTFTDCQAMSGGGVETYAPMTSVTGCTFTGCQAVGGDSGSGNAGGLSIYPYGNRSDTRASTAVLNGCIFTECTAASWGGGLRSSAMSTTVTDCEWTSCVAESTGGGICFQNPNSENILVQGCVLTDCRCAGSGGGIYHAGKSMTAKQAQDTAKETVIRNCTAANGGGIYSTGAIRLTDRTEIADCTAARSGNTGGMGGGIFVTGNTLTIDSDEVILHGCSAFRGGAVTISGSKGVAEISAGTIEENESTAIGSTTGNGGAIRVEGGATLRFSGGTIRNNTASGGSGGGIHIPNGKVNITGGTITGNTAKNSDSVDYIYGGAVYLETGTLTISGGTISGNTAVMDVSKWQRLAAGGAVAASNANSNVVISGGTITGNKAEYTGSTVTNQNYTSVYGGAVYLGGGSKMTLSGGTISDNTAVGNTFLYGAGICLARSEVKQNNVVTGYTYSTLMISGNPSFSGNTAGSLSDAVNGGEEYASARQDIYITGYAEEDAASLVLSGTLRGDIGSIWVWAEENPHYLEEQQFAVIADGVSVSDSSLAVFRNARPDDITSGGARAEFLRGVGGSNEAYIYWGTEGEDLSFRKTDGYGNPLNGAAFALYTDADCSEALTLSGSEAEAVSETTDGEEGIVTFARVPNGIYYMKETAAPAGYENAGRYVVLVGSMNLKVPDERTGEWAGILSDLTQEAVDERTEDGKKSFAIFRIEEASSQEGQETAAGEETVGSAAKAVTDPDIAAFGIMNTSAVKRRVILKKINESYAALEGAKFDILSADFAPVITGCRSGTGGIFWVGELALGTYYIHETEVPAGYDSGKTWFILTVDQDGTRLSEASPMASVGEEASGS